MPIKHNNLYNDSNDSSLFPQKSVFGARQTLAECTMFVGANRKGRIARPTFPASFAALISDA
jgi:hypothetical protein